MKMFAILGVLFAAACGSSSASHGARSSSSGLPPDEPLEPGSDEETAALPTVPPTQPTMDVFHAAKPDIKACAPSAGVVRVKVMLHGPDGKVTEVTVLAGPEAGSSEHTCIVGVVEALRFPRFKSEMFSVEFPYSL